MSNNLDTVEGLMEEARYVCETIKNSPTDYQMTAQQATRLEALTTAAETSLDNRTSLENQLTTARTVFKGDFKALEDFFRPLRQSIKKNPATTDAQRAELHLLDEDGGDALIDGLATAPLLFVEQAGNRNHLIRFFMTDEEPHSKRKPKGVHGCKIYVKIGDLPPASRKDCQLITTDTQSPYNYEFAPEDAGKKAHYIGVWVDKEDQPSPESAVFSITIA